VGKEARKKLGTVKKKNPGVSKPGKKVPEKMGGGKNGGGGKKGLVNRLLKASWERAKRPCKLVPVWGKIHPCEFCTQEDV